MSSLAFSPDGRILVVGLLEGVVQLLGTTCKSPDQITLLPLSKRVSLSFIPNISIVAASMNFTSPFGTQEMARCDHDQEV